MAKTSADIPPVIKSDYARLPRSSAVAVAEEDGYTKTMPMKKAQQPGKGAKQYGLPKSGKGMKASKMKGC